METGNDNSAAKPKTLDLGRYFQWRNLPCSEVRYAILRDPSRFAYFLGNALWFYPVYCLFFRHTPRLRIFWSTRIGGIF